MKTRDSLLRQRDELAAAYAQVSNPANWRWTNMPDETGMFKCNPWYVGGTINPQAILAARDARVRAETVRPLVEALEAAHQDLCALYLTSDPAECIGFAVGRIARALAMHRGDAT